MAANLSKTLEILDRIEQLPTLPSVLSKVIEAADKENTTASDLNNLISQDPALSSKTLKLANSAYYGFPRKISRITEAVVIMGFKTVKGLLLSASVCHMFKNSRQIVDFSPRELWRHSVAVGVCSEVIAKYINSRTMEELFILGILHDIGIILEMEHMTEDFIEIQKLTKADQKKLSAVEKERIGIDHGLIGKRLLTKWKLPNLFAEVVGFHHSPQYSSPDARQMASIIYLADLICELKKIGHDGEYIIPPLVREAFDQLKLEKTDIRPISEKLEEGMQKAEDFLKMIDES